MSVLLPATFVARPGLIPASGGAAYFVDGVRQLRVGNDFIEIVIDKPSKGGILSVIHKASGEDFVKDKSGPLLFYIYPLGVHQDNAVSFNYFAARFEGGLRLCLHWANFIIEGRGFALEVDVNVTVLDASGLTYWTLAMTSKQENLTVQYIDFPIITGLAQIGASSSDDYLVYPERVGMLLRDPLNKLNIPLHGMYPSAWNSLQFMSFYDENIAGLYVSTNDTQGSVHVLTASPGSPGTWLMQITHYLPDAPLQEVVLPYAVSIGVFKGDWFDAADIYRQWASQQRWAVEGTFAAKETPEWYLRLSAYHESIKYANDGVPLRNPFAELPTTTEEDCQYFGIPTLELVIGWESRGAYGTFGEWFPPWEGWESFDSMIQGIHAAGGRIFVMIDLYRYDTTLSSYQKEWAIVESPDGSHVADEEKHTVAMCPFTDYWQTTIKDAVLTLVRHKVDAVQLDGLAILMASCYAANHGHPLGYGNWWAIGLQKLVAQIRDESRRINPEVVIGSEGVNEMYLPYLDFYQDWDAASEMRDDYGDWQRTGADPIPLFQYVYPNSILEKGHYVHVWSEREYNYSFKVLGYSFVNGQPSYFLLDELLSEWGWLQGASTNPALEYLRRLGEARNSYAFDFVVSGQLLRPPRLQLPQMVITNPVWGASQWALRYTNTTAVLYSMWRAADASVGLALTNIGDRSVEVVVPVRSIRDQLESGIYLMYSVVGDNLTLEARQVDGVSSFPLTLRPREVGMLVFAKTDGLRGAFMLESANATSKILEVSKQGSNMTLACEELRRAQDAFLAGDLVSAMSRIRNASQLVFEPVRREASELISEVDDRMVEATAKQLQSPEAKRLLTETRNKRAGAAEALALGDYQSAKRQAQEALELVQDAFGAEETYQKELHDQMLADVGLGVAVMMLIATLVVYIRRRSRVPDRTHGKRADTVGSHEGSIFVSPVHQASHISRLK